MTILRSTRSSRVAGGAIAALVALVLAGIAASFGRPLLDRGVDAIRTAAAKGNRQAAASVGRGRARPIGGSARLSYGSTYTLSGHTGGLNGVRVRGAVVLKGRWNGGRWAVLARTHTRGPGRFKVAVKLERRGVLQLRLDTPDGFIGTKTLTVR